MKIKTLILFFLKFALTGFVLSFIFTYYDISRLQWHKITPEALILCGLLWFVNIGVQLYRWHFLLQQINPATELRTSLISLFGSFTLGLFTPGRVGELGRAFFIKSVSWKKISFLAIVERFFTMLALAICAVLGYSLRPQRAAVIISGNTILIAAAVIIFFISVFYFFLRYSEGCRKKLIILHARSRFLLNPRSLLLLFFSSLAFVAIFIAQTAILLFSLAKISFGTANAVAAIIHFSKSMLPFTFGDLGVREGIAATLMQNVAASPEAGILAALIIFTINVLLPAILGIPCIFSIKTLKR